ncbi:hypothetical protein NM208_g11045 [Fusarium decemcellulare]|uniref:Uncharacterized protein n=1 Tax=Fusarium decemcellulare TaxID=57161 RepID=A0ACC1RVP5_9HYPO|nr:hypothetical protein NM208_g11045 [Fusarium decemcellulare]
MLVLHVPVDHVSCDMSCTPLHPQGSTSSTLFTSFTHQQALNPTKPQSQPQEALGVPERLYGATTHSFLSSADSQRPPIALQPLPMTSLRSQQGALLPFAPERLIRLPTVVMPSTQNPSSGFDLESMIVDEIDAANRNSDSSFFLESKPVAEIEGEDNISEPANLESVDTLVEDGDAAKLSLSDFNFQGADGYMKKEAKKLITSFNEIKPYMAPILTFHLTRVIVNLWNKCNAEGIQEVLDDICVRLEGASTGNQELFYPYWFFIATHYDSAVVVSEDVRQNMAHLWGQESPCCDIIYPKGIPIHYQIPMYFGISPDADDPETTAKLVQHLNTLIETSPVTLLADMIASQLPASNNRDQDIEEVRNMAQEAMDSLRSTQAQGRNNREQLQETRKELKKSREEHKQTREELERTQQALKQTRIELDALTRAHAETKGKAERALRVSAMLLGSHLTPNSNKPQDSLEHTELHSSYPSPTSHSLAFQAILCLAGVAVMSDMNNTKNDDSESHWWSSKADPPEPPPVGGGDAVELCLSDFDCESADGDLEDLAVRLIAHFDRVKPYMAPILAHNLAGSLLKN